ncbi:twin-arginine translocation signal domain-containing protein [Actinomycetospora sp. OC33-EN08]|uniref:Twin-arginine translocation signal domain-containing protein n=1 Tax=Actinomycetospora aurantiaca TaxID=3129233 RepID=A0ABU8MG38_9PSEU
MNRRTFLGLSAAAVAAGAAACSTEVRSMPTAARTDQAPTGPALRTDWSRHPVGPLPATGDEGVPLEVTNLGVPATPDVRTGGAVGNLDGAGAVYLTQPLGRPVRTIGARFALGPGDPTAASLCLATWTARPVSDTNCHFVIGATRWIFGVARGTTLTPLRNGPLDLPQDGSPHQVSIDLDGGPSVVIHLPDGTTATVTDPAVADVRGTIPGWEFFSLRPGGPVVTLVESWAS